MLAIEASTAIEGYLWIFYVAALHGKVETTLDKVVNTNTVTLSALVAATATNGGGLWKNMDPYTMEWVHQPMTGS